jgi:hypothetical protein
MSLVGPAPESDGRPFGPSSSVGAARKPSPHKILMVNAAVYPRKPVLATEWPGTGTSTLVYLIAPERALGLVLQWPIISRKALKDGLYLYDAIGRVQEINALQGEEPDIGQFVHLGLLGTVLLPYECPWVLLIGELDKSDIDLLNVFGDGEFEIDELSWRPKVAVVAVDWEGSVVVRRGWVRCRAFPIVIITSNGERKFPAPFLYRCLKLDIEPPTFKHLGVTSVLVAWVRHTHRTGQSGSATTVARKSPDRLPRGLARGELRGGVRLPPPGGLPAGLVGPGQRRALEPPLAGRTARPDGSCRRPGHLDSVLDMSLRGDPHSWWLLIYGNRPKPATVGPRLLACLDKMRTEPAELYAWKF